MGVNPGVSPRSWGGPSRLRGWSLPHRPILGVTCGRNTPITLGTELGRRGRARGLTRGRVFLRKLVYN